MNKLWVQVSCEVPTAMVEALSEYLLEFSPDGVITENRSLDTFSIDSLEDLPTGTVTAYFAADRSLEDKIAGITSFLQEVGPSFDGFAFKPPVVSRLKEEDWSSSWKAYFKPSRVGRAMVIKPTWEEFAAEAGDIVIEIDPGMAFGTGTHATTRLCLEALEKIFRREGAAPPLEVLDVGVGSGILAIAAARLGARRVTAIDIDPQAVEVAARNIALNRVEDAVEASQIPLERIDGSFGLVVANILAEDLVRMAAELVKRVEPGGFLILSGILTEKEGLVLDGFSPFPVTLAQVTREGEWSCVAYGRDM